MGCPCCEFGERYTEQGCFLAGYVMGYEDKAVTLEGYEAAHRAELCEPCLKLLTQVIDERKAALMAKKGEPS